MDRTRKTVGKAGKDAGRAERLAEALRQNLRRRKDRARRRKAAAPTAGTDEAGRGDGPDSR